MAKIKIMGSNSSYKAMCDVVEQAKAGTIFIPDDFVMYGTPDAVRSGFLLIGSKIISNSRYFILYKS